ncbi:MAG: phage portal protein [Vallitaleaceae bacterium]|nr:phage portal protein [Vallitaleaceae bacterium]
MITFKHRGDFKNTEKLLKSYNKNRHIQILEKYGQLGVDALSEATPIDSGVTKLSWEYKISTSNGYRVTWNNTNTVDGIPVVILIQYGHGTSNGAFIQGRDFIKPAMKPIFDKLADELWREVTSK